MRLSAPDTIATAARAQGDCTRQGERGSALLRGTPQRQTNNVPSIFSPHFFSTLCGTHTTHGKPTPERGRDERRGRERKTGVDTVHGASSTRASRLRLTCRVSAPPCATHPLAPTTPTCSPTPVSADTSLAPHAHFTPRLHSFWTAAPSTRQHLRLPFTMPRHPGTPHVSAPPLTFTYFHTSPHISTHFHSPSHISVPCT